MKSEHMKITVLVILLVVSVLPILPAFAQTLDNYQLTSFGSKSSLSPDGREIVFVNYSTFGPASYPTEIWIIGFDGSNARMILKTPENIQASNLQFSPDGSRIAYIGEELDGSRLINVVNRNGDNPTALRGTGNTGTLIWSSNESIIYTRQEAENSVSFYEISLESSQSNQIGTITMLELTRFVVAGNMVLANEGRNLIFTAFGAGQARSDIFSLDLETNELQELEGFEDFFLVGLGNDNNTMYVGQGGGSSLALFSTSLDNPEEKAMLLDGNLSYSVYESPDKGLIVAYAYAPGGSAPFDPDRWSTFGVYVACEEECGPNPSIFSGGYTLSDGQYVRDESTGVIIIAISTSIAVGVGLGVVLYARRIRKKK